MTKKDYIQLAKIVKKLRENLTPFDEKIADAVHIFEGHLIDWLSEDNPRFDRGKFLQEAE